MSADDFDPAIERLYSRAAPMPDADLFAAEVQGRLASASRLRTGVLTLAGLCGGVIAVREMLRLDRLSVSAGDGAGAAGAQGGLDRTVEGAVLAIQAGLQPGLESLGLDPIDLTAMGGMPLFWLTAAGLLAVLALGAVRLSQEA